MRFDKEDCKECYFYGACVEDNDNEIHINCPGYTKEDPFIKKELHKSKRTIKALSIKEPWATLIRQGKKTIETRTWKTKHRGEILLLASKKPTSQLSGKAFAIAKIVSVKKMKQSHEEKANCRKYPGAFSWFLEDVRPIKPFAAKGQLSIFTMEVNEEQLKVIQIDQRR